MTSAHNLEISKLQTDLKDANAIALTTLRANGELGVVINFLEKSFACKDHVALGQQIFKAVHTFGLSCSVQLRFDTEAINACDQGFDGQGIGIPEGEEGAIFDKFIQSSKTNTGAGGNGLGLSIVKEIVQAHNGYVAASGNAHGGARFLLSLPIISHQTIQNDPKPETEVDFF